MTQASPYGYGSALFHGDANWAATAVRAMVQACRERNVISVFIRLHPLLPPPSQALMAAGTWVKHGQTIPVDLTLSDLDLDRQTRMNHRVGIRRLREMKFTTVMDDWSLYDRYFEIYQETMARLNAHSYYRFSRQYFSQLKDALQGRLHLICVLAPDGSVAAAGLFTIANGIVEYHLGGTAEAHRSTAPSKLMIHAARVWAKAAGGRTLHLGGGFGAQHDSLFHFKSGFSKLRADFATWRIVCDEDKYAALVARAGIFAGSEPSGILPGISDARRGVTRGKMNRILLSVPHMGGREQAYVAEAFASNWLSTVGPNIGAFEREFEDCVGAPSVALSSGTAAIHLGLRALGVGAGDQVFCSDLTFAASANPIRYLGAEPVFIDSEYRSWNMDPQRLADALEEKAVLGRLPKAVVVVHLFGQCADMAPILELCGRYGIPVLEDAAEALGGMYQDRPAGTLGDAGAFSFNGNKIITTTGGGMLSSRNQHLVDKARFWATQARDPGIAYEHSELGYNYRMSNVLAGIGRGQLKVLEERVCERRAIAFRYQAGFEDLAGISLMPEAHYGRHTYWLSCFFIDDKRFGCSRDELLRYLDMANIESRPLWKPMHMQPLYAGCECFGGSVSENLFRNGICLPSSSSLTEEDQQYVIDHVRAAARSAERVMASSAATA